jgi:hypothetical protein
LRRNHKESGKEMQIEVTVTEKLLGEALYFFPAEKVDYLKEAKKKLKEINNLNVTKKLTTIIGDEPLTLILARYLYLKVEAARESPNCVRPDYKSEMKIIRKQMARLKEKGFFRETDIDEVMQDVYRKALNDRPDVLAWVLYDMQRYRRKGRPEKKALGFLIKELANLYKKEKGRIPWKDIEVFIRTLEPRKNISHENLKEKYYSKTTPSK